MIISKPKISTLTSLFIFIILGTTLSTPSLLNFINNNIRWYDYFLIILLTFSISLLFRIIFKFKTITIGKGNIIISRPSLFKTSKYNLNNITFWKEVSVKSIRNDYKEIELYFSDNYKLTISNHEYTNYNKIFNYLKKKRLKNSTTT